MNKQSNQPRNKKKALQQPKLIVKITNKNPKTHQLTKKLQQTTINLRQLMSKSVYVLFSQLNNLKPKMLKSMTFVNKNLAQNLQYKLKVYNSQGIAQNVFQVYQIQYKRYLANLKLGQVSPNMSQLTGQNQTDQTTNIQAISTQQNNQQPNPNPVPQTLTQPKEEDSSIIKPKTLQQLIQETQSLLNLTASMPNLLQNFTPTPIFQPIPKNGIFTGYFDGCSKFNPGPASVGYYMTHGENLVFESCSALGTRTNNQAQFSALLFLLTNAYVNGIRRIRLFGDSKIVVESVNGKMKVSNQNITDYYQAVEQIIKRFTYWKLQYVERQYNTRADKLSNIPFKTYKKKSQRKKSPKNRSNSTNEESQTKEIQLSD